ncbi:cell division protein FtsA, partial [Streptococcus pneumoniae]
DISKVLKTSRKLAEGLKLNYGEAYPPLASKETFQVEVIGEVEAVEVTEAYLSEIISARIKHILEQIKQELDRRRLLDLPGGIVLIGGNAILPGMVELAQEVFGVRVKLYVPNQVGIRNPAFAHVISLSEFAGQLTEVNLLAQGAIKGENDLSHQPISFGGMLQKTAQFVQSTPVQPAPAPEVEPVAPTEPMADFQQASQNKPKLADRFRGLIGSMFDE